MPNSTDFKYELILEKINNLDEKLDSKFENIQNQYHDHEKQDNLNFGELRQTSKAFFEKMDKILLDTDKGIVIRLDRLETSEKKKSWFMKTAFGGVLASIGAHIWNLIKN